MKPTRNQRPHSSREDPASYRAFRIFRKLSVGRLAKYWVRELVEYYRLSGGNNGDVGADWLYIEILLSLWPAVVGRIQHRIRAIKTCWLVRAIIRKRRTHKVIARR